MLQENEPEKKKKENEPGQSIKNNSMHNSISNKNDSRNFLKLQIQRKQRHGSELRHTLIAYPIGTNLILDKENYESYWIIGMSFLLLSNSKI